MKPMISCCGVVCSECPYHPTDCPGCPAIEGNVFWLQYTGEKICDIYDCCIHQKKYLHCGLCPELPCARYKREDPTQTPEENAEEYKKQLERLRHMK